MSIDEYIASLEIYKNINEAVSNLHKYESQSNKNYEIFLNPEEEGYVICESKSWEMVSRKGYKIAEYDD